MRRPRWPSPTPRATPPGTPPRRCPTGVADVGTRGEPNLDALFATNPDLVIVEAYTAEDEIIAQLAAYGVPVLATKGADAADPIEQHDGHVQLIAEATGREERAEVVVDEFNAVAGGRQGRRSPTPTSATDRVRLLRRLDRRAATSSIRPFGQGSLMGELGEELGLTNAWTGEVDPAYGLGQTDIEGMTRGRRRHVLLHRHRRTRTAT